MKLNLGIIYRKSIDQTYHMCNHRSLLKIIINPFLGLIGLNIATNQYDDKLGYCVIVKCKRQIQFKKSWKYELEENQKVEFRRWLI